MIDVDAFKLYNDRYGHLRGDEALRRIAVCLERSGTRPGDLGAGTAARSSSSPCLAAARRQRWPSPRGSDPARCGGHPARRITRGSLLTVSIGMVAAVPVPGGEVGRLVSAADRALYVAKADGRDRVVVARDHLGGRAVAQDHLGAASEASGLADM